LGTITALKTQSRNRNRISVFVDGKFAFGLAARAAEGLAVGQVLSASQTQMLRRRDEVEKGKAWALRLISIRPRSEAEIRRSLARKEYGADEIETILDDLRGKDLLNDEQFARYWVEQRETFKPRSRRALRAELMQKGVGAAHIEAATSDLDETQSARIAARKQARRWHDLSKEPFRIKLGQYLQRRGFHYGIIKDVTNELWQAISEERDAESDFAAKGN
jgi:regulatory protein